MSALDDLGAAWRAARNVVVLTGAGLSTASGIPDFRSPGGRWSQYRPVTIQEFLAGEDARARYWRYKGETWEVISAARPNPAHAALADLVAAGRVALLVTQNVDGLHERSGVPAERLVTIHGTDSAVDVRALRATGGARGGAATPGKRATRCRTAPAAGRGSPRRSRSGRRSCRRIWIARCVPPRRAISSSPPARRWWSVRSIRWCRSRAAGRSAHARS